MVLFFAVWISFGIASSLVASNRGGSGILWFIAGCIVGPLALICAFFEGAECPYCRSKIHSKATKCPKCQSDLKLTEKPKVVSFDEVRTDDPSPETKAMDEKTFIRQLSVFGVIVGLIITVIIAYNLEGVDSQDKTDPGSSIDIPTDTVPQAGSAEPIDARNDWRSYSELHVGGRLINTYEVRYAVEEAIGAPDRELRTKVDRRDAWLCSYIRSGKEIEIVYLRDIDPPRNMWAYTIRQRNFVTSPALPGKKSATSKPWKSVESLRVGNTIINEGELRMYIEALLGESMVGGDGKSVNDSTWICKYRNEGRDIEITYQWHIQSDYMSVRKIRFR